MHLNEYNWDFRLFFIACVAFETALRLRMAAYDQTITKFVSKPVAQNGTQILLDHHA